MKYAVLLAALLFLFFFPQARGYDTYTLTALNNSTLCYNQSPFTPCINMQGMCLTSAIDVDSTHIYLLSSFGCPVQKIITVDKSTYRVLSSVNLAISGLPSGNLLTGLKKIGNEFYIWDYSGSRFYRVNSAGVETLNIDAYGTFVMNGAVNPFNKVGWLNAVSGMDTDGTIVYLTHFNGAGPAYSVSRRIPSSALFFTMDNLQPPAQQAATYASMTTGGTCFDDGGRDLDGVRINATHIMVLCRNTGLEQFAIWNRNASVLYAVGNSPSPYVGYFVDFADNGDGTFYATTYSGNVTHIRGMSLSHTGTSSCGSIDMTSINPSEPSQYLMAGMALTVNTFVCNPRLFALTAGGLLIISILLTMAGVFIYRKVKG
jgi:hypothetical protein